MTSVNQVSGPKVGSAALLVGGAALAGHSLYTARKAHNATRKSLEGASEDTPPARKLSRWSMSQKQTVELAVGVAAMATGVMGLRSKR